MHLGNTFLLCEQYNWTMYDSGCGDVLLQIIAEYEEQSGPCAPQGGDGTSGSSVGSASPDAFHSKRNLIPPSNIPMKSGVSSQPMMQPHRSSPSIGSTNSVRSSPALYIDTSAEGRGENTRRHHPLPSHKLNPPYHMDRSREPRDRPINANHVDKPVFHPVVTLRPQPDVAPVLTSDVDNRHSVEVTEQDLNSGMFTRFVRNCLQSMRGDNFCRRNYMLIWAYY